MFKKIRRNYILISIASITLILTIIFTTINVINYRKVASIADDLITILEENDGNFPMGPMPNEGNPMDNPNKKFDSRYGYETRFFIVTIQKDVTICDLGHINSVSDERALELAYDVNTNKVKSGYIDYFRYRVIPSDDETMIIFVDCSRSLTVANNFLINSTVTSLAGVIVFFLLIFFSSGQVLKPVKDSYDKQKTFISNASHELKTPLTIISANNELLEIQNGKDECNEEISKQVKILTEMVHNLSTLAKLDEGRKANMDTINLCDPLFEIINSFEAVFKQNNIDFSYSIPEELNIKCDSNLMQEFFSIMFDNARKYSNSYFKCSINQENKKTYISLENDVCDSYDIDTNKIFERFYRSDVARTAIEGSGIGLSIAREIIDLHKGEIEASFNNGVFTINCEL